MRQDPDVILVGEMRDIETVRAALSAAETGHLVLATLHTVDAQDTINRIVDFFTPHEQAQIRATLSQTLRGIVSQRLVRRADGGGRTLVAEVMVNTGRTAEAIVDPSSQPPIVDLIEEGEYYKMQSFDQHLFTLVRDKVVAYDDAIAIASRPHDLMVTLRNEGVATG
jgi:twitching motility protein PilT